MYCVGKIDREKFVCIAKVITTDEVIITDERIAHSNLHQNAFERFGKYIPEVLSQPDFFFADKRPNTVSLIKRIVVEGQNVQLVLRLHVPADKPGYKNSVLSFWNISEERRENYFRNKKVIYKRKET